jgi:hypothetical protein
MKMLVGVPVFRVPDLVRSCLTALSDSPADILVVDNAADTDVKQVYNTFKNRVHVSFNSTNEYCNGGWNRIFQFGLTHDYDLIAIGSSDAALHPGWYEAIQARAAQVCNEVWVPSIGEPVFNPDSSSVTYVMSGVAGFFTFLPREAVKLVYPIPHQIRHWFGDQYMYETLRQHGWKVAVLNQVRAHHQQSAITAATPEAYDVIKQDIQAWKEMGRA